MSIIDPGFDLTLRPMKYPKFYNMYVDAIKNTWSVGEVDFSTDVMDLRNKLTSAERHMIQRLVAFFATGDSIVSNNLVLNLYRHINSPEARMYLSRQIFEEAQHIQFYLTLLDTYITDEDERAEAFGAIATIPSLQPKSEFCLRWFTDTFDAGSLFSIERKQQFIMNLICFAACVEGLFFFGAFAYVYFMRSKGLLNGLAAGTNWVFRDESCVPAGTEILTEQGYTDISLLRDPTIKVAQYHEDGTIDFVIPRAFIERDYNDNLMTLSTDKSLYQSVTKDHDIVLKSVTTGRLKKVKPAQAKLNWNTNIPTAGYGIGSQTNLEDWQRFAIAFQADGTYRSRYDGSRVGTVPTFFNFTKNRKKERFETIVNKLGWSYTATPDKYNLESIRYTVNVPVESIFDKEFDWVDLPSISAEWGKAFVEELSYWDGFIGIKTVRKDTDAVIYDNSNIKAVNKVAAIGTLSGFNCATYWVDDNRKESYSRIYSVYFKRRDYALAGKATITSTPYNGKVYCTNVPTGMIIIRQNGKVCITGNCHMTFAFEVIDTIRKETPELFDGIKDDVVKMIDEAITCESLFAEDMLQGGIAGLALKDMKQYLQYVGDQRLQRLGYSTVYNVSNPFAFMEAQDIQELSNFFERRSTAYQASVSGSVDLNARF